MSSYTATISGPIILGQVWALDKVGYNDQLVFTSSSNSDGSMQLTATRTRGIVILRRKGDSTDTADVFCLDSNMKFSFIDEWSNVHCPSGETQVVMANDENIDSMGLDDWNEDNLKQNI